MINQAAGPASGEPRPCIWRLQPSNSRMGCDKLHSCPALASIRATERERAQLLAMQLRLEERLAAASAVDAATLARLQASGNWTALAGMLSRGAANGTSAPLDHSVAVVGAMDDENGHAKEQGSSLAGSSSPTHRNASMGAGAAGAVTEPIKDSSATSSTTTAVPNASSAALNTAHDAADPADPTHGASPATPVAVTADIDTGRSTRPVPRVGALRLGTLIALLGAGIAVGALAFGIATTYPAATRRAVDSCGGRAVRWIGHMGGTASWAYSEGVIYVTRAIGAVGAHSSSIGAASGRPGERRDRSDRHGGASRRGGGGGGDGDGYERVALTAADEGSSCASLTGGRFDPGMSDAAEGSGGACGQQQRGYHCGPQEHRPPPPLEAPPVTSMMPQSTTSAAAASTGAVTSEHQIVMDVLLSGGRSGAGAMGRGDSAEDYADRHATLTGTHSAGSRRGAGYSCRPDEDWD